MNILERDALEVLSLVQSVKNLFAPINRIPPEVLSLIPDYWHKTDTDRDLITLTHVCRGWRKIFVSRSSLWSHLDCKNVDKTRAYIERSKTTPLEIYLEDYPGKPYTKEAFLFTAPHISRLRHLTIFTDDIPDFIDYFFCRAPLLEELYITVFSLPVPILSSAFLNGDLSSLRKLSLNGVITHLPCKSLSNLTTFTLRNFPKDQIAVTQLLNLFEGAPLLHTIEFEYSIPGSSDAPPGQVVLLPCLKKLTINAYPAHSILLNHLSIPSGASLHLEFGFSGDTSLIPDYLPKPSENIKTLSRVTTINLLFDVKRKYLRLDGPDGETYVLGQALDGGTPSHVVDCGILRSLDQSILSTAKWLVISKLRLPQPIRVDESQIFHTLCSTNNLRALMLTECHNQPFILALNPNQNLSNHIVCPKLEDLVLCIRDWISFPTEDVLSMAEARALRGTKLWSITIVATRDVVPGREVLKLREHVGRMDFGVSDVLPDWDSLPDEVSYGRRKDK